MLKYLYFIFKGKRIKEILPAPSKYDMDHYANGTMTKVEYRGKLDKLKECMEKMHLNN
jgi:hypothetical protein